jgi:two-component system cell cycle response regulator DivK
MTRKRILIVEDNQKNMKLARDVLEHHGYVTIPARTAEDALATIAIEPPDLVLMDIALPGIDGFEALGRLKADENTAAIPVCALTAFAMNDDRERCLRAGFDGYLAKPIDVIEFPRQVRGLLDAREGTAP